MGDVWLLVHVEVQSRKDPELPHRMWVYHYRTYDLYRRPVVSLAILADSDEDWKENRYATCHAGCQVVFTFPFVKLLAWKERLDQLESSRNPFALVVASHLRSLEAGPKSPKRLHSRLRLFRSLRGLGLSRDEVDGLMLILDVTMELSPELEEKFDKQVQIEEEEAMELTVPNRWLEKGLEKGRAEGREETRREMVQRMLAGGLSRKQVLEFAGLASDEELERLLAEPGGA